MSAMDLFRDGCDANFRLAGTTIIIGRLLFTINDVADKFNCGAITPVARGVIYKPETAVTANIELRRLPMRTMYDCPSGYLEGQWYSRAPARHRYQGLVGHYSLWGYSESYGITYELPCDRSLNQCLSILLAQPRRAAIKPGEIPRGAALTNEIMVTKDNCVMFRGNYIGDYQGKRRVKLASTSLPESIQTAVNNASLSICD